MIGALLTAVRDRLRTSLSLDASQCDIAPEGHPPSEAAREFIAVDEGNISNAGPELIQETFEVVVTVCRQPGQTPIRKRGEMLAKTNAYVATITTMTARAEQVISAINGNWTNVIDVANTEIGGSDYQITGALFYVSQSRNRVIQSEDGHLWVARDIVFRGAWRPR